MNIIQKIKNEKPWSSTSKYYVAFHMVLFAILWSWALWMLSEPPLEEPNYIDPMDTSITEKIAGRPSHMNSKVGC